MRGYRYVDKRWPSEIQWEWHHEIQTEIVWSCRGRHFVIVYDAMTPPQVVRFGRNLATWFRIARVDYCDLVKIDREEFRYGGCLFFQNGSSYISAVDTLTKFGMLLPFSFSPLSSHPFHSTSPTSLGARERYKQTHMWYFEPQKRVWWQQNSFYVWESSERSSGMVSNQSKKKYQYAWPAHTVPLRALTLSRGDGGYSSAALCLCHWSVQHNSILHYYI